MSYRNFSLVPMMWHSLQLQALKNRQQARDIMLDYYFVLGGI